MPILTEFIAQATAFELIGILGFGIYAVTYFLLTLGRIDSGDVRYYLLNLCAACCVMIGLTAHFNLASAMIQSFWIAMSLVGVARRLSHRAAPA